MPKYQYNGDDERSFPTLGITVKKGDSFDGPDGLTAPGLSKVSSGKTAPAVAPQKETTKSTDNPSAELEDADTSAGA